VNILKYRRWPNRTQKCITTDSLNPRLARSRSNRSTCNAPFCINFFSAEWKWRGRLWHHHRDVAWHLSGPWGQNVQQMQTYQWVSILLNFGLVCKAIFSMGWFLHYGIRGKSMKHSSAGTHSSSASPETSRTLWHPKFITVLTSAAYLSIFCARWNWPRQFYERKTKKNCICTYLKYLK
jgi:hypothetical protein